MLFFANRSSRHAARLGSALTAHPARHIGFSRNRRRGEQTMRAGNPFKLALCLALAIPFALAACGRSSHHWVITPHQHWTATYDSNYLELTQGKIYHSECYVLLENVSKEKHSSRSKHNPDYPADTLVVTSKFEHYPGKSGDKICIVHPHITNYVQTKENEFIVQASLSDSSEDRAVSIDYAALETAILYDAAALGRFGNFKYGVFDNTEERKQEAESQVTGSTSRTTGSETGIVTPLYKSTYGVRFGNESTTTSVDRTPNSITVNRKHSVRYYNSEPDTDGYFNVDLILKSLDSHSDTLQVIDSQVPNAKYCYPSKSNCGYFISSTKDFERWTRR